MRAVALLALAILLAGCASPASPPPTSAQPGTGALDLSDETGLLALDLPARRIVALTPRPGVAWMSPGATVFVWLEETFSIVVNDAAATREVGPSVGWARVFDNATGLELTPGEARWRGLENGTRLASAPLPPAPATGVAWTAASDDLAVLAGEYAGEGRGACQNDVFVRAAANARTRGCHVQVAHDGRVGWTEAGSVRVMGLDGAIRNVTAPPSGDVAQSAYVAHENPVFTREGVLYLRLTGGSDLALSELVGEDGVARAKVDGPKRLALLGASEDGQRVLVRVFER